MNRNKKQAVKLSPQMLRSIVEAEVKKGFGKEERVEDRAGETDEVEADEFADTLDKHIDIMKAMKMEEARLVRRLSKVRQSLSEGARKLVIARVI
jgi:hypothetical protein